MEKIILWSKSSLCNNFLMRSLPEVFIKTSLSKELLLISPKALRERIVPKNNM